MLLSVVSVLVVAQSSSEVPEGLTNNPVYVIVQSNTTVAEFIYFGTLINNDNSVEN